MQIKIQFALLLLAYIFTCSASFGQQKQCGCKLDKSINESTASCDTKVLSNGSKLYYQFNCDSVWLTLENKFKHKKILYSLAGQDFKELYGLNWRLGYQLAKEFNNYLLFRSGCPATGACDFRLIDKTTGREKESLGQLIYDYRNERFDDFVIYFSNREKLNELTMYYVDSGKKYVFAIDGKYLNALVPEFLFDYSKKGDKLFLSYEYEVNKHNKTRVLSFDLLKYHR